VPYLKKMPFRQVQIIIWVLITVLYVIYKQQSGEPFWQAVNFGFNKTISYLIILYVNAYWLIPFFYKKNRYLTYFLLSVALIFVVTYLSIHEICLVLVAISKGKSPSNEAINFMSYGSIFISLILIWIFSFSYRYILDFFYIRQQQEILQKQHAEAQLNLLKAQVQPHFLFNTLNNIYYVAQLESPLTAELVEKLSSIMRYFLEEGPKKCVLLSTEFDFIKSYIDLEKIRMRYPLRISMDLDDEILGAVRIPPMLLIPLVENVFKHGIDKTLKGNFISIEMKKDNKFTFKVANKSYKDEKSKRSKGTGLKNLTERLDMLYGVDYSLKTMDVSGVFTSELTIPL